MYAPLFLAIKEFFGRAKWGGKQVPVVFAGPDRAHAELTRITRRRLQGDSSKMKRTRQQVEDSPAPRPFMSLWIAPPKFHQVWNTPATIRGYDKDTRAGTAKKMRMPRPVEAQVQVDLWCGEAGHIIAQSIEPQIELQFVTGDMIGLPIDWTHDKWYKPPFNVLEHARDWGRTRLRLYTDGWDDSSNLEFGQDAKEVRRTWSGRMEAHIPYRPEEARLVRTINLEILNAADDPPTLLETIALGVED
jgi:hypothetical protein